MPDVEYEGRMVRSWASDLVPVPRRKPTTGIEPPDYRKDVFKGARRVEWDDWSRHVQNDSELSNAEKKAYHDIFAAEGGMRQAPGGTAVAGILRGTLRMLRDDEDGNKIQGIIQKHGSDPVTGNLDYDDVKEAYKGYFDSVLSKQAKDIFSDKDAKGSQLIRGIGDDQVASTFADIIFRDGIGAATSYIQKSIIKHDPD